MKTNLITGWKRDRVESEGTGSINPVLLLINTQELNEHVPHIISPIYGSDREYYEYYFPKAI